jgi:hypothetical protein
MKRNHLKIFITLAAVALPVFVLAMPHFAYADCGVFGTGTSITDCIFVGTSWIAELAFTIAGAFLTITGVLLNGTMVATLNISQIVAYTPAIGTAWRTIRDFSSIFIIFLLLYASIVMILGVQSGPSFGKLLKNIIIAGLLINFSLFMTKFVIDTSNIVSLSFYNAIAPGVSSTNNATGGATANMISNAFNDGGLSNVFMQKLDVQRFTGSAIGSAVGSTSLASDPNKNRTITMAYAGGTVLMFTAAFSFLFAAVAFAVRLGVLILLMAFSPIYFIGMIIPKTQEYSKIWLDTLLAMCIFMPVYLLLMYVAVSVINDPHFFDFAGLNSTAKISGTVVNTQLVGIVLQYIIAFLFINAPMVAAIKIGSEGSDIAVKWGQSVKKWGQGQLTKGAKKTAGFAGQHVIGRGAAAFADNDKFKNFTANHSTLGTWASTGLKSVSGASFAGSKGGYDKRSDTYSKTRQDVAKRLGATDSEVDAGMAGWNAETADMRRKSDQLKLKHNLAYNRIGDPRNTEAANAQFLAMAEKAQKDKEDLDKKIAGRKERAGTDEGKEEIRKEIAGKITKERTATYATNLEGSWNPITKNARKDAAEKIRKNLNKSKKDKALDAIKELIPDDDKEKGGNKEDKKDKGGDSDKAKK